tara:strand:+ start:7291 stop:7524 length:234 start_codon:yes stop_codon:yes gene_type:complete
MPQDLQKEALLELAHYIMPFGKYQGHYLTELPEYYLVWFRRKGFPKGKLGALLAATMEIKENGLEDMIRRIRKEFPK